MYTKSQVCKGVAVGLVVSAPEWCYGSVFGPGVNRRVHVYEMPNGCLAYSTSPEGLGISWLIGHTKSLDEIGADRNLYKKEGQVLVWVPEAIPQPASIDLWDEEARSAFATSMAASGGYAALVNRRRGANLVDDRPDPDGVPATPRTPMIVGELQPQIIRGPEFRWEGDFYSLLPAEWIARYYPWAKSICDKAQDKSAPDWAVRLVREWESRGLDIEEFAKAEIFNAFGNPENFGVTIKEAGEHLPRCYYNGSVSNCPQEVIEAANAVVRKQAPVSALRRALRDAGLYRNN